ncbi:uncharacterized protein METZ01_LOCUS33907 [marine metagenome]|uniref:Uncharacterized protein n=1 Tax=marine metagenome TaxID=408172 RepID=A0A381QU13_9ZZZZ
MFAANNLLFCKLVVLEVGKESK